jgi:hypothetical protein
LRRTVKLAVHVDDVAGLRRPPGALTAGQVLTDLARTQLGSLVGVLVVPAVHPAVARAPQELNPADIITVR